MLGGVRPSRPSFVLGLLCLLLLTGCTSSSLDKVVGGVEDGPTDEAPMGASAEMEDPTDASSAGSANTSESGPTNASTDGQPDRATNGSSNGTEGAEAIDVQNASLGGTVAGERFALTVHDATYVKRLPDLNTSFRTVANEEEQYMVLDLSLENTGDRDVRLGRDDLGFQITDGSGYAYENYWIDDALDDVVVLPGTRRRGPVVFKTPRSSETFTLYVLGNLSTPFRGRYDIGQGGLRYSREHATRPQPDGEITFDSFQQQYLVAVGEITINNTADRSWTPVVDVYLRKLDWEHTESNVTERVTLDPHEEETVRFAVEERLPEPGKYYARATLRREGSDDELDTTFRHVQLGE